MDQRTAPASLPEFEPSEPRSIALRIDWHLVGTGGLIADASRAVLRDRRALARLRWPKAPRPGRWRWGAGDAPGLLRYASAAHVGPPAALRAELAAAVAEISALAERRGLALAGGGLHPLQGWTRTATLRAVRPAHAFRVGTLAIRIGCDDADAAVRLAHALSRFVPHLAVLAASSPMAQGVDTGLDSARLQTLHLRPGACALPWCADWAALRAAWGRAAAAGALTLRDGEPPWDVQPLASPGGVELRVADTPLAIEQSVRLAVLASTLARWIELERPFQPDAGDGALHAHNRMAAARQGYAARLVTRDGRTPWLRDELAALLARLAPHAEAQGCGPEFEALALRARMEVNDSATVRRWLAEGEDAPGVVRRAARLLDEETRQAPAACGAPAGRQPSAPRGSPGAKVIALTRAACAELGEQPR